jgi:hypothetical protein
VVEHKLRYEVISSIPPTKHRAVCSCRAWSSPIERSHQEAEDHGLKHLRLVEQARASLGPRAVSAGALKAQRDWARDMAEDPVQPEEHRVLWRQLADEITKRIGDGEAKWEDVEIPFG